jgi:hypothetical protein
MRSLIGYLQRTHEKGVGRAENEAENGESRRDTRRKERPKWSAKGQDRDDSSTLPGWLLRNRTPLKNGRVPRLTD